MIIKIMFFTVFLFLFSSVFADDKIECFDGLQLVAKFSNKSVVCDINQFLPANSVVCSNCPNGYTCSGGELLFNETKSSGIDYTQKITKSANNVCSENFPRMLYANFKIAERNCNLGYYLPANSVECTICLKDHYCPGGILTFNETVPQGIEPCPEGTFAPMGSSMCYEHILHIGDDVVYLKSTKLTTPSLNIGMDDGVFYANMTTVPTPMNSATERYLKIEYNNQIYYVCDDTTYNSD